MGEKLKNPFVINEIRRFGDEDAETQQVILKHVCPQQPGEAVQLNVGFTSLLAGKKETTCDRCGHTVTIIKKSGNIYLA